MTLYEWRIKHKMAGYQLANRLGVSASTVSRWELGIVPPGPKNATKIVELTKNEVTFEDLYGGRSERRRA
jgi:transcriptional regulator with XRE-family HTH domain